MWVVTKNGQVNGLVLHLKRGETYRFEIEKEHGHQFFITTSPVGGSEAVSMGHVAPVESGHFDLHVDERTPRLLYYQDSKFRCLGGQIIVHST